MNALLFLAQEAPMARPDGGLWQTVIMLGIAAVFFYFILFRPEQKRRQMLEEQRTSMKQGDKVIAMGILGEVVRVQDETVIVKMHDGSKLEFLRGAITEVRADKDLGKDNQG
jgi:preprotein translocase subunit YajC